MIEHRIYDDFQVLFMRRVQKAFELFIRPELRVDERVIGYVVLMIAARVEYRRKIQSGNAQVAKIRELVCDPVQIAAREGITVDFSVPSRIDIAIVLFMIATEKSVYKNLIEYRGARPIHHTHHVCAVDERKLKERIIGKLKQILFRKTFFGIIENFLFFRNSENIGKARVGKRYFRHIIGKDSVRNATVHLARIAFFRKIVFIVIEQFHLIELILGGNPQYYSEPIARHGIREAAFGSVEYGISVHSLIS